MKLTIEDIQNLVASKESNSLEFKETTGQLSRGMEYGCAFLNSQKEQVTEQVRSLLKILFNEEMSIKKKYRLTNRGKKQL